MLYFLNLLIEKWFQLISKILETFLVDVWDEAFYDDKNFVRDWWVIIIDRLRMRGNAGVVKIYPDMNPLRMDN